MDDESGTKSESEHESENKSSPKKEQGESDESLSLSLTPPIVDDKQNAENSQEISEQLTSNSDSFENDRSYQEIEISNRPDLFNLLVTDEEVPHISQENPSTLDISVCSDNSIISLNYLKNLELGENVRSILDEILQNDQFQSDKDVTLSNSKEPSLNIFADLDLDDKSLSSNIRNQFISVDEKNLYASNFGIRNDNEVEKRIKDFEELIAIKDSTIAVLTSELESFRELSNTNTISTLSTTEYKQLQEECHSKLSEYNNIIIYKNDLIQQLSESLEQSVVERKELLVQIDHFKDEIIGLQKQLQETTRMVEMHHCHDTKRSSEEVDCVSSMEEKVFIDKDKCTSIDGSLTKEYIDLQTTLNLEQKLLLKELQGKFKELLEQSIIKNREVHEEEILKLKNEMDAEKKKSESEIIRLRDLLVNVKCGSTELMDLKEELEAKHSSEVEELRTYFEKKCADLEKNYSEEIFSQQSRKMSDSTCSEDELKSDPVFSYTPGPDGDIRYDLQLTLTKKDIHNLHNELNSIINRMSKYNLDNMSDDDFQKLKTEIGKSNLNNLLKYDISVIRNELQKKYQTEMEILRENNEKTVDELSVHYEEKLKELEEKYLEEIKNMKTQLDMMGKQVSVWSTVQEVGSSGEFEINEVVQSYERRLQEQVTLAKIDIITALESQIQRLCTNEADDEEWPSELLGLRDKFTNKYEAEIEDLKKEHRDEIEKLKEEHSKMLNGVMERARRRSLRDSESLGKGELEILRERDTLKKQVSSLRSLLGELLKYFTQCEDELNNTLVDELLKQGFDKNLSQIEDELNLTQSSPTSSSKTSDSLTNITRVHLTPNFKDLINLIENGSQEDCDSKDISLDLKNELGVCLEKLKQDANTILAMTSNISKQAVAGVVDDPTGYSLEERVTSLTRQLICESQSKDKLKEELEDALRYAESLEKEKDQLEVQMDQIIAKNNMLETDLAQAKSKIAQLIENGHKEIISEGYGEEGTIAQALGDTMTALAELQEKARNMLSQSRTSADPTMLHLIEELCRVGERIKEESKKERHDLQQQIEAADKKYRTTQKFLEEQAIEREQERDEAQKKMEVLQGQLRERDKDRANWERAKGEVNCVCCRENRCTTLQVEQLEQQLQEMTKLLDGRSLACRAIEAERDEAIEKIKVLRDIIRELEHQTDVKSKEIDEHLRTIEKLQCICDDQQEGSFKEGKHGDSSKDVSDAEELCRHIEHLEYELQRMRAQSELAGSEGALKQIRSQLYEMEMLLDKKTKALESLHSTTNTNCSSPSEDISARDLVLPRSPKKMDDSEVPLQQLARLKEKLLRHSRAEDAAIKRTKDLEMQVFSLRQEVEESCGEKEYLKKEIQEQLVLISDLQIRLDQQRIRAEHIEKETNTSLELKIYDLQAEIASLREKLQQKEKTFHHQQSLLEGTRDRMKQLEEELSTARDDEIIVEMQRELEELRSENVEIKSKMDKDARMVPSLVENIISDKNVDIEKLRCKLDDTEKLLEAYTSLNLDRKDLQTISNLKSSGTSLEELISIIDLSQADQMRRMESRHDNEALGDSQNMFLRKGIVEETVLEPEISSIDGPSSFPRFQARNSTEVSQKRVHFEDTQIESLKNEVAWLKDQLNKKDDIIKEYEERLNLLTSLESKIEKLQLSLEETEKALATATETFEREQLDSRNREKDLGVELAEKKLQLSEMQKKNEILSKDSQIKDEMYLALAKERKDIEKELNTVKHSSYVRLDTVIKEKNLEIDELQARLTASEDKQPLLQQLDEKNMEAISLRTENEKLTYKLNQMEDNCKSMEDKLKTTNSDNVKLRKELDNNAVQIQSVTAEMTSLKEKLNKKRKIVRELEDAVETHKASIVRLEEKTSAQEDVIVDRECELEILNEDAKRYQNDIALLEEEIRDLKKGDIHKMSEEIKEKDEKIKELNKERAHMLELLNEKDKIITQMAEDSRQLHVNLVTIKSKIKEPGNIIDLGNKLKEEQKRSAELIREIHDLKVRLMQYKNNDMVNSVDEITDQLRRELDHSAQMDSNIMSAVSDQSLNSLPETHDAEVYKKFLAFEKESRKRLAEQVDKLQQEVVELRHQLEKERSALVKTQTDDAKMIEQLSTQLDVALDREEAVRKELDEKKNQYELLDRELDSLKRKHVTSSESTEYRQPPSKEMLEVKRLKRDLTSLQMEKDELVKEVDSLRRAKLEIETGFKYTKELLSLEVQKTKNLEDKVRSLVHNENQFKERLRQKEIEAKRMMEELERQNDDFTKQKMELLRRLKAQSSTNDVQENVLTTTVPDCMLEKIKELNNALLDNRKLMEIIQKISSEKRALESELDHLKGSAKNNLPFGDLTERCDFLFAKTLKLESVKKALVWQKRYLMEHLQGHHQYCMKQALPDSDSHRNDLRPRFTLKRRFRSAAFAIVSIIRMKYLVRRWHSGVRIAEKINARHYKRTADKPEPIVSTGFRVGQPVSSQVFANASPIGRNEGNPFDLARQENSRNLEDNEIIAAVSGNAEMDLSWSGKTPPSKERKTRICIGTNIVKKEDLTPLRAPQLLAQFVERFDQIQEKLGVALETNIPQGSC